MAANPDRLKEAGFFYTINACMQRTNHLILKILSILSTFSVCVRVRPWQKSPYSRWLLIDAPSNNGIVDFYLVIQRRPHLSPKDYRMSLPIRLSPGGGSAMQSKPVLDFHYFFCFSNIDPGFMAMFFK